MPDRHRRNPIGVRLTEDLERWLRDHAAAIDQSVHAVIVEAVREYRARREEA